MGILLELGLMLAQSATPAIEPQIRIEIQRVEKHKDSVTFHIEIVNTGRVPVALEETTKRSRDPHVVNMELWQNNKWVYVGPLRDAPALAVFPLLPGETVRKRIAVSDPYADPYQVPPRPVPLVGKARATVRYFQSEEQWRTLLKDTLKNRRQTVPLATSEPFNIPPKPN